MPNELTQKRQFSIYVVGQTVSSLGDGVYVIAFMSLTLQLSNSGAIALGGIFSVYTAGELLFGFIAGSIADNSNKKRLLLFVDILRACILVAIYILVKVDLVRLLHIYLCTFAFAALTSFFHRIEFTIIPIIVHQSELMRANAILTGIKRVTKVVSPIIGGLILQVASIETCFLFDAASFLFSSFCISLLKYTRTHALYRASILSRLIKDIRNGFLFVLRSPFFLTLTIYAACINFAGAPIFPLLPLLSEVIGGSASHYGMMLSGLSAGLISSSFLIVILDKYITKIHIMLSGLVICSISIIMIAFALNFSAIMIACFALGLGLALSNLPIQILLQEQLPRNIIGAVSSFIFTIAQLTMPISMIFSGFLLESVKITVVSEVISALMFIGAIIGFFLPQLKPHSTNVARADDSPANRLTSIIRK